MFQKKTRCLKWLSAKSIFTGKKSAISKLGIMDKTELFAEEE